MLIVDLFCGCGGFSSGASMAGHEVVLAIDNWHDALETHQYNHPKTTHINMDLGGDLNTCKNLIMKHVRPGNKWHLHGSPPCQSLSVANRTQNNTVKGMQLVNWYLDLVKLCKPDSWSMEQVIAAKKYFRTSGYRTHIINTVDYMIPQTRKRLFVGEGWNRPVELGQIPLSKKLPHLEKEGDLIKGYKNSVSVRDAVGNHVYNRKITGLEGFKTIHEPTYTLCATGPLKLFRSREDGTPVNVRNLTIRESLTIQGFPTDYIFPPDMSKTSAFKQIGNAVSPPIAYLIMMQLKNDSMVHTNHVDLSRETKKTE